MRYSVIKFLALFVFAYVTSGQTTDDDIRRQIDDFMTAALSCENVPGGTVAVVRDNEVFHTQGYGVKDIDTQEPVTDQSLFVVASITKAFVATLAGLHLSENGYTWQTPIKDILGDWFHLSDPYRTSRVTMRDLLAHRTNLPLNNPTRIYGYTTRELMERMRFLNYTDGFRDYWHYNNLMYGLASHVSEVLGGKSWEDLTRDRLFTPLGMTSSTFAHQADDRLDEFAKCYEWDGERLRELTLEVPKAFYSTIGAPGAVTSNAVDMAKWIIMQINEGRAQDQTQVVPSSLIRDTWRPIITTGSTGGYKPNHAAGSTADKYGLGWTIASYRGYYRVQHGGSIAGYRTRLAFLPDMKIGLYFASTSANSISGYLTDYVMDLLLGYPPWGNASDFCTLAKEGRLESDRSYFNSQNSVASKEHGASKFVNRNDGEQKNTIKQDNDLKKKLKNKPVHHMSKVNIDNKNSVKSTENGAKALTRFVGRFGNYGYGNVTTYINQTTNNLMLRYGPATWALTEGVEGEFSGPGLDPFWYWTQQADFHDSNPSQGVWVWFETTPAPPYFLRDLDIDNNLPPPSTECP